MAEQYPELNIDLSFSDRVADLIDESFDLAVRVGELPNSPNLVARPLGMQRMSIWASPAYLEKHGRPASIDDLSTHVCIGYARSNFDSPWKLKTVDTGRDVTLQFRLKMDDLHAIRDAAIAGLGLAWLPCWMVNSQVRAGELERVLAHELAVEHPIHAVWPKTRHLPSKTRALVDLLVEQMPAYLADPPKHEKYDEQAGKEWPLTGSSTSRPLRLEG
jgi:DNA-binding transcriptional LysR family regulator